MSTPTGARPDLAHLYRPPHALAADLSEQDTSVLTSFTDWLVMLVGVPAVILVGCWASWKVWRRNDDVSAGVTWATGDASRAGYHAFILPSTLSFACVALALVIDEMRIRLSEPLAWLHTVAVVGFVLGVFLMLLSFWMWAFMWPRFLVPPHLRGERGWIPAVLHEWRAESEHRTQVRSRPRGAGGKHRLPH